MKSLSYSIVFAVLLLASAVKSFAQTTFTLQYPSSNVVLYSCGSATGSNAGVVEVTLRISNALNTGVTQEFTLGINPGAAYSGLYFNAAATLPVGVTWTGPAGAAVQDGDKSRVISALIPANDFKDITFQVKAGCNFAFSTNEIDLVNPLTLSAPGGLSFTAGSNKTYKILQTAYLTPNPNLNSEIRNGNIVTRKFVLTNSSQKTFTGLVHFSDMGMTDQLTIQSVKIFDENHDETSSGQRVMLGSFSVNNSIITGSGITQNFSLQDKHWLVIEEEINVSGCVDNSKGKSVPTIEWGCADYDYLIASKIQINADITVQLDPPKLEVSHAHTSISSKMCLGGAPVMSQCSWVNTSTTTARNVRVILRPRDPVMVPVGAVRVYITRANGDIEGPYEVNYTANNITPDYLSVNGLTAQYTRDQLASVMPGFDQINPLDITGILGSSTGPSQANIIAHRAAFNDIINVERNNYTWYNSFETGRSYYNTYNSHPNAFPFGKGSLSPLVSQPLIQGQTGDLEDIFFIRQLVVNKLKAPNNIDINEIVLNHNDRLTVQWDEYILCMQEGSPGDRIVMSPHIFIDWRDGCNKYTRGDSFYGDGAYSTVTNNYYPFLHTSIGASLTAGVNNTEGDPDRCIETADGRVETISFDIKALILRCFEGSPSGTIEFKLYLQDGLDLDRSLSQPFAWDRTNSNGFNNLTNVATGCKDQCATCVNTVVPQTNKYRVRFTLRDKSYFIDVPASAISVISDDDVTDQVNAITYNQVDPATYNMIAKKATFMYTIRINVSDLMNFISGDTYEALRRQLDGANVSFDLRAYCPSDKHTGKSGWQVNCSWIRCNPYPTTTCDSKIYYPGTASEITMFSRNAVSLFTVGSEIQVNCPGCKIPGTELVNYTLIRTNVGQVDADDNGEPDGVGDISLTDDNRRILAHGDVMQASFAVTMPDGSDDVSYGERIGCTKEELDARNYLLDNIYVRFLDAGGQIQLVPGTIEAALYVNGQAPVWKVVPVEDIITDNGQLMIRVRASLVDAEHMINNQVYNNVMVNLFHTNDMVLIRASFTVLQVRGVSDNIEFNYQAGFSACDDCNVFGRPYDENIVPASNEMIDMNPASREKTHVFGNYNGVPFDEEIQIFNLTDLDEVGDNAYFWCTNGGNVFRFIPFNQSVLIDVTDKTDGFTCVKKYTATMTGEFYESSPNAVNFDAFPKEYRRFFAPNSQVKQRFQIPAGYEVFGIEAVYYHRQGNAYDDYRTVTLSNPEAIERLLTSITPANSIFDRNLDVVLYLQEDADNIVSDLSPLPMNDPPYRATYNYTIQDEHDFKFPIDEESYKYTITVRMRPIVCEGLTLINFPTTWGGLFTPQTNIPDRDGPLGRNPNALATINTLPWQPMASNTIELPTSVMSPPVATMLVQSQASTTNLLTGEEFIQVPVKVECSNEGNASFPYFRVKCPPVEKGLRLLGVYKGFLDKQGAAIQPALYEHYFIANNNETTNEYIIGIDQTAALKNYVADAHYNLPSGSTNYYTFVFTYECGECNAATRCDINEPLGSACLDHEPILIDYGWNCNAYPSFENIDEVCHAYTPLEFTITTAKAGLSATYHINNEPYVSETIINSCNSFTYKIDLTSCREGQVNDFEVRLNLPQGITLGSNATINSTLFSLNPLTDGSVGYKITAISPVTGLPHKIVQGDLLNRISLSIPLNVNCSFDAGPILTTIDAKTYCGIPVEKLTKTILVKTLYDEAQLDDIDLSQINVLVNPQSVQLTYNIPSSSITHDNFIRVTLPDEFILAGSNPAQRVITLAIPATGIGTETISLSSVGSAVCNEEYDVKVELLGSYIAQCPQSAESCTKTAAFEEAIYKIKVLPFTVTLNNPGTCVFYGTLLTATTVSGNYTYTWYRNGTVISNATSASCPVTEAGVYKVEVSNGICSDSKTTAYINLTPIAQLYLDNNAQASLMCNPVPLRAEVSYGTPAYTGTWSWFNGTQYVVQATAVWQAAPNDHISKYTATVGGKYMFTVTDANGCSSATIKDVPSTVEINPPAPVCPGETPLLEITNMGSVIGTFSAGWFDASLPLEDQDLLSKITHEGYYYAAAIIPSHDGIQGCTLTTTQSYHIQFKAAPAPFTLTPDGFIFACKDDQHTVSIVNKSANDRNANGIYYDDNISFLWSTGATTLDDQTFTGNNNISIAAIDNNTGCVTRSSGPEFGSPTLHITRTCTGIAGQVKLSASANLPDQTYTWWSIDANGVITAITSGVTGTAQQDLIVTQPGTYMVRITHANCGVIEAYRYENMVISASPNTDLLNDVNGRFEGITTCEEDHQFDSQLGCIDRSIYNPLTGQLLDLIDPVTGNAVPRDFGSTLPGNYMINYGTSLNANSWNPGYWQGSGYNSNGFMIVDGTPVLGDKVVWSTEVEITQGHYHLFRAMVRNITTDKPPVPQERPQVELRVSYYDANGILLNNYTESRKILFSNTNKQWVELSGFTLTEATVTSGTGTVRVAASAKLELVIGAGTALGRDFAIDNVSFIPVGLCDNLQDILDVTGRNCGSVANVDFYQKVTCGESVTFNVFDLATDPGITYTWRNAITDVTVGTGKSLTVTPDATTSYILKVENTSKGCSFEQTVKAIKLSELSDFTAVNKEVCNGSSVQLNASGANSYVWTPATGLSNANIANPVASGLTSTTVYTVTGNSLNGCSATKTVTVTVKPLPVITVTPSSASLCTGIPLTLTASGADSYVWSTRSDLVPDGATAVLTLQSNLGGNPLNVISVTGTTNGCASGGYTTIGKKESPVVSFTAPTICAGGNGDFNTQASGTYDYLWSSSMGLSSATAANPIVAGSYPRSYNVTVTDPGNGCSITRNVIVNVGYTCGDVAPNYDGVNDRTTIPYKPAYNRGSSEFTVEAWVKLSTTQSSQYPMILASRTAHGNGFIWCMDNTAAFLGKRMLFQILGTNYYSTPLSSTLFDDQCHHLAVSRTASGELTLYIDGVAQGSYTGITGSINTSNTVMTIATETNGTQPLRGSISEVRFWSSGLSSSDIANNRYNLFNTTQSNLIGYWKFKQINTQVAVDESGTRNNGYYGNSVSNTTYDPSFNGGFCGGPRVVTVTPAANVVCAGRPLTVNYTTVGFASGVQLQVFVSNASGTFTGTPNFITTNGTGSGTFTITAPQAAGTGYLVKVKTSDNTTEVISAPFTVTTQCTGLTFDGNDMATAPHHNAYNITTGDFTIEAWVNLNTSQGSSTPMIISKRTSTSDGFFLCLVNGGTQMILQLTGTNYHSYGFPTVYDGQCHHLAVRRIGTTITFFIDGSPRLSTGTSTRSLVSSGVLRIGADYSGSGIAGTINEIRLWNVGKSDANILNNRNLVYSSTTPNLIAYWRFKEIPGVQTITDESATANHGNLGTTSAIESTVDPTRSGISCFGNDRNAGDNFDEVSAEPEITYYPNPFDKLLTVFVNDVLTKETTAHIQVFNINGVEVYKGEILLNMQNELYLDLPAGLYMSIIRYHNNTAYQHKIIKVQ